jgi:inositol phosphorylceramide mannosyltransferase catalytic subunit
VIPRVIHRIWLGGEPMPEEFERYGRTWSEHHPGWEVRLWTDGNLPDLRHPDALERCRNEGEQSDLIRYEVLLRFGGVYVDTDVECLRPIDSLLDAEAFVGETRPGKLGSAVVGAVAGHPGIDLLLDRASERAGVGHQAGSTGPGLLTNVLRARDDVKVFGPEVFYPFHRRRQPDQAAGRDVAYAVHHVQASWKSREDLRKDIRRLRGRVERGLEVQQQLRRDRRRLRKQLERSTARERDLAEGVDRARSRLHEVEVTRWWRLRAGVGRAMHPVIGRARRRLGIEGR